MHDGPRPKKVPVYRQEGLDWVVYFPDPGYGPTHKRYITLAGLKLDYPKARPSRLGKDPLAGGWNSKDPKIRAAYEKRQAVHHHNALRGSIVWSRQKMDAIERASTTTQYARELAIKINQYLELLQYELKHRIDQ